MVTDRYLVSSATEKPILFDSKGRRIDVDELIEKCRDEPMRVLADDEIGIVIYVGDLDICMVTGLGNPLTGELSSVPDGFWGKKVFEISRPRFASQIIRRQIGSVVMSTTADNIFLVREGQKIRKVRGDNLKEGMTLNTGEKVYW